MRGLRLRRTRRRPDDSATGTTIPPVAEGFAPQGGMAAVAGFRGVVQAARAGNRSQRRAARAILAVVLAVPALVLVALVITVALEL